MRGHHVENTPASGRRHLESLDYVQLLTLLIEGDVFTLVIGVGAAQAEYALSNSFAFGWLNAVLAFGAC